MPDVNMLDLDVLGFIDHNITVNVIKSGDIVEKKELKLPETDQKRHSLQKSPLYYLDRAGAAADLRPRLTRSKEVYRCKYCEEKFDKQNL